MLAVPETMLRVVEAVADGADGVRDSLCSVRSVDIPVAEFADADRRGHARWDDALRAVEDDGAHRGIPVVDPVAAGEVCTAPLRARRLYR